MMKNTIIVIGGPTASGKSALAMDICQFVDGIIINSDSMQVYQNIPVITACPTAEDKAKVEHRLFEIYECSQRGNVVDWFNRAVQEIEKTWTAGRIPVVVGGTGLYIDNLINGVTPVPETPLPIRQEVAQLLKEIGLTELYRLLKAVDPETAAKLSPHDTTRICRAYEVWQDTKCPLSVWHKQPLKKSFPKAHFIVIKICPERENLDRRCYQRFDKMLKNGALEEVKNLAKLNLSAQLPAMKALGVPELMAYIKGECSLPEAVNKAKLHTRQYAKRQRTWFKNKLKADIELASCYEGDFANIKAKLRSLLVESE